MPPLPSKILGIKPGCTSDHQIELVPSHETNERMLDMSKYSREPLERITDYSTHITHHISN